MENYLRIRGRKTIHRYGRLTDMKYYTSCGLNFGTQETPLLKYWVGGLPSAGEAWWRSCLKCVRILGSQMKDTYS